MAVIERDREIADIRAANAEATEGTGSARAITGESGAGKSALVAEICAEAVGLRVLTGLCDALSTPRPLGPFRDIAGELGQSLADLGENNIRECGARHVDWVDIGARGKLFARLSRAPVIVKRYQNIIANGVAKSSRHSKISGVDNGIC